MTILETLRAQRDQLATDLEEMRKTSTSWGSLEIERYVRAVATLSKLEDDIGFMEAYSAMAHAPVSAPNGHKGWTTRQRQRKGEDSPGHHPR